MSNENNLELAAATSSGKQGTHLLNKNCSTGHQNSSTEENPVGIMNDIPLELLITC
jgi:hypothetical protein